MKPQDYENKMMPPAPENKLPIQSSGYADIDAVMKEFKRYRKRPVIIHAKELTEPMDIETLEGMMHANTGDFLLIGVENEQYPCKRSIFLSTYDLVEEEEETK
jgi:hypothetical protein